MCYNKLHVDTSKKCRYFYYGHSQKCIFDVPCGICEECIRDAQMDYFLRMKAEYDACIADGGKVAFVTFTYNDDSIPAYVYHYDSDLKDIVFDKVSVRSSQTPFIYAFDRSNLQRFFNSYRKRFERYGIKSPFRYIVFGEYGTDIKFTQRSHFHALIYFTKEAIDNYRFFCYSDEMIESVIMSDINSLWKHGNCSKSKDKSLFITDSDACIYCSKYVSKTMTLANLRRFAIFRDFISSHLDELLPADYNGKKSLDGYFRYYLRKVGSNLYTLKSKNFGCSALQPVLNRLNSGNYDAAYEFFKQGYPYRFNNQIKYIGYSMYYFRKLCYNAREDGSFYLNSTGREFQTRILSESVDSFIDQVKSLDFRQLSKTSYDFVCEFLGRTPLYMVAYYKLFSHNRCYSYVDDTYERLMDYYITRDISLVDFDFLCDDKFSYLCDSNVTSLVSPEYFRFGDVCKICPGLFHNPFYLSDYCLFIDIVDNLVSKSKKDKCLRDKLNKDMTKYLRDINNYYIYSVEPNTL